MKRPVLAGFAFIAVLGITSPAATFRPLPLSARDQKELRDNFTLCISKLKGPYTENFWVCADGQKVPVRAANGQIRTGCKNPLFCSAFRAPWAEALAKQGMYIGNLFSRDLHLWDSFPDHNDKFKRAVTLLEQGFDIPTAAFLVRLSPAMVEQFQRLYARCHPARHRQQELRQAFKKNQPSVGLALRRRPS